MDKEQEMLENVEHALKNFNGRAIDCIAVGEMLIKYKKIKQELESVKEIYYTQAEIDKNYIPKAKVTEAIREYQKRRLELADGSFFADPSYINNDTALVIGISVLQDLLKTKEEENEF